MLRRKLALRREVVRHLGDVDLRMVVGGLPQSMMPCQTQGCPTENTRNCADTNDCVTNDCSQAITCLPIHSGNNTCQDTCTFPPK